MNCIRKKHLVDMILATINLQSEWTCAGQWSLQVKELKIEPHQCNDYEVTIMTHSEDEACLLYMLLKNVTDLTVTLYANPSIIKCI